MAKNECVTNDSLYTYINIKKLLSLEAPETYLYEFIKDFGYNSADTSDIYKSLNGETGKIFLTNKFSLLKDRTNLIIKRTNSNKNIFPLIIKDINSVNSSLPFNFSKEIVTKSLSIPNNKNIAYLDASKIKFPITIRHFAEGDYFYPIGLNGKKTLSDYFNDLKLNKFQKEGILIIESNNKIIWVAGKRIDDRFKISKSTKDIIIINYSDKNIRL